jgi:hypothetical protein
MKRIVYLLSIAFLTSAAQATWAQVDSSATRSWYEASEFAGPPPFPSKGGLVSD